MDVTKIIDVLSGQASDINYTSLLFENGYEKYSIAGAVITFFVFIIASFFGCSLTALISISLTLIFLISYSIASFLKDKKFLLNPIKVYSSELKENVEFELELVSKLAVFKIESIKETKALLQHDLDRIKNKIAFMIAATERVGLFPSALAVIYAFYEFKTKSESTFPSAALIGITLGLYLGVLLLKRITAWQEESIYLLEKAERLSEYDHLSPTSGD